MGCFLVFLSLSHEVSNLIVSISEPYFKGIYLLKALSFMKQFLYKQKLFFIKETDIFGHIVVWTIYTSHIDHFMPQHTAFEQSAACLSVVLELLPGLIPFAILWHAGWTLEKTICMNMNYYYMTAIFRSIWPKYYVFLVLFIIFQFDVEQFISKNCKYIFSTGNLYILGENSSNYCSRIIIVHVHATVFFFF